MEQESEPLTLQELNELTKLEQEASGHADEEVDRRMRARLMDLRAKKQAGALFGSEKIELPDLKRDVSGLERKVNKQSPSGPSVVERVEALETEVKRLRELIENQNG